MSHSIIGNNNEIFNTNLHGDVFDDNQIIVEGKGNVLNGKSIFGKSIKPNSKTNPKNHIQNSVIGNNNKLNDVSWCSNNTKHSSSEAGIYNSIIGNNNSLNNVRFG